MTETLHDTPLKSFHEEHGANMVAFAGWHMPLHYGSILDEHKQTRESGSLFDVSHMGRVKVSGRHARKFVERVVTRRVSDMDERQCRYALVCHEAGGVLDDVLVYRFADHWLLVVNASNREKLLDHFKRVAAAEDMKVEIDDQTFETAMVAVQGPAVMEMVGKFSSEIPTLKKYRFTIKNLMILKLTVSRTGYTGEDGVEVILPAKMVGMALKLLVKDAGSQGAKIKPAGLGARDTLRMEAGMPLYGHELDEQTDPLSAGLTFGVTLDKGTGTGKEADGPPVPRFIGQEALERIANDPAGPPRRLIGLKLEGKRSPRQGYALFAQAEGGEAVGVVTSGCLSPTLGHPIAMAYVGREQAAAAGDGATLYVQFGKRREPATVTGLPFYKAGVR